jgi:hypothetical protein
MAGTSGSVSRQPEPYLVIETKLAGEWSAGRALPHITAGGWLQELVADNRWQGLPPLVKVRLLLAGARALNEFEDAGVDRAELVAALDSLSLACATDREEWVRVIAAAVSGGTGRLNLAAAASASPNVTSESFERLAEKVAAARNESLLMEIRVR